MIEDINTNTATARERARALAEAHMLYSTRCASLGMRKRDLRCEQEWMA